MFARHLRRIPAAWRQRFSLGALILLYHRIDDPMLDANANCITRAHFAEQMEMLARSRRAVPLDHLAARIVGRKSVRGLVALTFDDGYADNVTSAVPILEGHGMAATFFVPSRSEMPFWWDRLERLLSAPTLPRHVSLLVGEEAMKFDVGEDVAQSDTRWNFYASAASTPRQKLFQTLYRLLHDSPALAQHAILSQLESQLGGGDTLPERMSREQIAALAAHQLFQVGSHSQTHPALSLLPRDEQEREITGSKRELESITGMRIHAFAYPHGAPWTFTRESIALARAAGYRHASTAVAVLAGRGADPFALPRIPAPDAGAEDLGRLARWLD
jgi:peptidoglycan/xylan/chitin deacetylase (PgdA/CDA1 family)